jgi:putative SOS response-associated peptidase YedK
MCGRVNVSSGPLTLLFMDMVSQPYPGQDRHNMAPTEPMEVLRPTALGALESVTMRWWLTPYWSKEMSTRYSMFNAKSETIDTSASFKEPFARRRCVLPVAGYYEWTKDGDRRLPYYIRPQDDAGMLLAGVWDRWRNGDDVLQSFAVVTTAVHDRLAFVHRRQPVMLSRAEGRRWMDRTEDQLELKRELLCARLPVPLSVVPVSTYVNTSRNDGERCIEPIGRTIEIDAQV